MPPVSRHFAYVSFADEDSRPSGTAWADWAKESLESFAVPRNLAGRPTPVGPVPPRLSPVVKSDPRAAEPMPETAAQALEECRVLVVVCSPSAAASARVAEEIRFFKKLGRDRIIALIVAGEPDSADPDQECFPETLKYEIRRDGTIDREWRVHPISIDVRGIRPSTGSERLAKSRRVLVAAALGVPPEAVPQMGADEPVETNYAGRPAPPPARGRAASILALLGFLAAGALAWFAYQANEDRKAAQAARKRSDEVIVFLQRNMREKLAPVGQLGLLAEANERVTEHLERVARETNDPIALTGLADAFHDSATILDERGNHQAALESAVQAAQARRRVADSPDAPADTALHLMADQMLIGRIYLRAGQAREALAVAEETRGMAAALSRKRLGDPQAELALVQAHSLAGDAFLELSRLADAERAYHSARELARQLAARMPRDVSVQQELAAVTERSARLKERQGDPKGALAELAEWQRLLAASAVSMPDDLRAQITAASAQMRVGNMLMVQRQHADAAREFRKAAEILEKALQAQPGDRKLARDLILALNRLGTTASYDPAGQTEALTALQRALDLLDRHFPGETDLEAATTRTEIQRLRAKLTEPQAPQ